MWGHFAKKGKNGRNNNPYFRLLKEVYFMGKSKMNKKKKAKEKPA